MTSVKQKERCLLCGSPDDFGLGICESCDRRLFEPSDGQGDLIYKTLMPATDLELAILAADRSIDVDIAIRTTAILRWNTREILGVLHEFAARDPQLPTQSPTNEWRLSLCVFNTIGGLFREYGDTMTEHDDLLRVDRYIHRVTLWAIANTSRRYLDINAIIAKYPTLDYRKTSAYHYVFEIKSRHD